MPVDLIVFMRWLGLVEAPASKPRREMGTGTWYKDGECPF